MKSRPDTHHALGILCPKDMRIKSIQGWIETKLARIEYLYSKTG